MKSKKNKITNKEIEHHIGRLYNIISQLGQVQAGLGNIVYNYIDYKKDKEWFASHCKDQQPKEEDEQNK